MKAVLAMLIAIMALGVTTFTVDAGKKKCKPGQEYDEALGRCVTPRGS